MIRVALFISGGEKGGSKYRVLKIAEGLKDKVEFTFFTFYEGMLTNDIRDKNFKNYHFKELLPFKKINTILKDEKFDLIHTYGFRGNFYGRVPLWKLKIPVVSTYTSFMRDDYNSKIKGIVFEKIDDLTLNIPEIIIVSSKAILNYVKDRGYKKTIKLIHVGIDVENDFYKREDFGLKEDDFVIGSVMRFEKVKNPLFLIDVFYEVQKREKNSKLVLVGDGSLKSDIERKIKEYNIEDKVKLLGFRKDAKKIYKIFDVFALTSLKEGFSISTLEAMSSFLPVVVSDCGGVREMVEDGVNGFIIKDFNKDDFVEKILLFKNKDLKRDFGDRNRKKIVDNFLSETMCNETLKVYEEVIK
ncbi:MAG TPA: glycosyltransferase family 4 protein [Caldisericia bacterium]|nr:glycosyltransferase family 4 protein [Caldisericia bacterium]HOL82523.1 glycosyltransferase family 4 protein [Caldisericia bacterium]HPC56312.1 glycosyltransferase family 4 protein [Caldisericia bacterium]HPP43103.1 glycosyltransferase family 4 protein [Caldisericia bacterium]HRT36729.1 glycosyltransferase family 4 protein [Caldisericia bacterium]